jgi:hypothetical protein
VPARRSPSLSGSQTSPPAPVSLGGKGRARTAGSAALAAAGASAGRCSRRRAAAAAAACHSLRGGAAPWLATAASGAGGGVAAARRRRRLYASSHGVLRVEHAGARLDLLLDLIFQALEIAAPAVSPKSRYAKYSGVNLIAETMASLLFLFLSPLVALARLVARLVALARLVARLVALVDQIRPSSCSSRPAGRGWSPGWSPG